jgi:uncharacterized protein YecE (DUF72 family)
MADGTCYVGTSGWSYAHWAKGRFYPKGLKQGEWLSFLAARYATVEINSSFYRLPKPEFVARWRSVTPRRFRFAVKLWRRITHERRLAGCESELADFLKVTGELGPKRGPVLVQLPPSLRKDTDRLGTFLAVLKKTAGRTRWKVAVEFRNREWLSDEVGALLSRHQAALCLSDLPRCPVTEPNDAPFVYVRRHGPGGGYRGCYALEHIRADAERVGHWLAGGKDVYVYYNNDLDGHAVDNARQLTEALDR